MHIVLVTHIYIYTQAIKCSQRWCAIRTLRHLKNEKDRHRQSKDELHPWLLIQKSYSMGTVAMFAQMETKPMIFFPPLR